MGVVWEGGVGGWGRGRGGPVWGVYGEVVEGGVGRDVREGRIKDACCSSLTVTNGTLKEVYDDIDYCKKHLTICESEILNSLEVIRLLGVIAMYTAI